MNARLQAWLLQACNDLELAQLARDNGFLASLDDYWLFLQWLVLQVFGCNR